MAEVARGSLVQRMIGAAMLNVATYEEVEADRSATGQAAVVVAIVAVATAIGAIGEGTGGIIAGLISAFVGWLVWSALTYVVGTRLFGGTADMGEMLRTIGFAQAPGVLNVLGIIPILGGLVRFVVFLWILAAAVIAIRQALDFSTGKAVGTALVGAIAYIVIMALVGLVFGGMAMLGGAIAG
ncbi:MAG: YIP1 family protein [Gemmatimonadota bacterium]